MLMQSQPLSCAAGPSDSADQRLALRLRERSHYQDVDLAVPSVDDSRFDIDAIRVDIGVLLLLRVVRLARRIIAARVEFIDDVVVCSGRSGFCGIIPRRPASLSVRCNGRMARRLA